MIDFTNKSVIKLSMDKNPKEKDVLELLAPGEQVVSSYSSMRDYVVFTNKRVISVNVQGLTGKKKDFTSLPYSKVQAFSIETAGHFDLDSELQLVFSSLGTVIFEFTGASNVSSSSPAPPTLRRLPSSSQRTPSDGTAPNPQTFADLKKRKPPPPGGFSKIPHLMQVGIIQRMYFNN